MVWYSFDGGVTFYNITGNKFLDQTAWAELAEGDVTITFYANDTLGNEASISVTVVKRIPADDLETGIVIIIVVVSIAGRVAILAAGYIFMKRRQAPV